MKKLLISLPIIIGVTVMGVALAAENTCDLTSQYKVFAEATQKPSYSSEDIQEELSARWALLGATINCAQNDVDALRASVPDAENDQAELVRDRIMDSLNEAGRFYKLKENSIKDQGIQGTKDLAKEIRAWRETNHENLANKVRNFSVWNKNQNLFDKASDRLSQSQFVINSLKLLETEDSQKLYYDAKSSLDVARELNRKAGDAIANGLSSDETLLLLKSSLETLSDTYKKFLAISGELTKVLPTEKTEAEEKN